MKNIHVLPTDKLSRIYKNEISELEFLDKKSINLDGFCISQNIYITSDEEIKEGDWCLNFTNNLIDRCIKDNEITIGWRKIILTTDQDLIEDGVQSIPDEFLEWFVKNPSCEEVNVKNPLIANVSDFGYKIIIPKEEPEQETFLGKTISKKDADKDSFEDVTKYKIEKGYSEEIVDILDNVRYWEACPDSYKVIIERFIEQNKKK